MTDITFPKVDWITNDGNLCSIYIDWECKGSEFYHEVYLLNKKNNKIAGHFQSKGCLSVQALSDLNDSILEYEESVLLGDNEGISKNKHQIIKVNPDLSYEVLHNIEYIEGGIEDGTFAIQKNGLYGFIDYNGFEFIKPQYEKYYSFHLDIACVKKDGKWGFINKQNEVVIPFGLYNMDFEEKYLYRFPVLHKNKILIPVRKNNCWGVIDTDNNTIISFQYEDIWHFGNYFVAKKDGKLGVIDTNENIMLPFEYDEKDTDIDHPDFIAVSQNGLVGLLDKNITIVIPIAYKFFEMYEDDNSILALKQNGKSVLLDFMGNEITEEFDYIKNCFEGMYIAGNGEKEQETKFAFLTETGEFVTEFEYESHPDFFNGGLCIAERYSKYGENYDVINTKGEVLHKLHNHREAFNLGNGDILVRNNNGEFVIKKLLKNKELQK